MLIDITDMCSLECKHCLSSCTKDGQHIKDYCEIDDHYIDFFGLWEQTCEYHETETE